MSETQTLNLAHISMQFSDTDKQMAEDVDRIFERAIEREYAWFTGTEAGGEKSKPLPDLLRAGAKENDYRFFMSRGEWIAVSRGLISGGWEQGYVPVLESSDGEGKHTDRGVAWVSFDTEQLGRISVGDGHYLTNGRRPGDPNYLWNTRYAQAVGAWAEIKGAGKDIVFYHGDQNIVDRTDDTFRGAPLTSLWDELKTYENTGHGNIDVIATLDADRRVKAKSIRALDDKEFFLHTDHFLVEGSVEIGLLLPPKPQPVEHVCLACGNVHIGIIK